MATIKFSIFIIPALILIIYLSNPAKSENILFFMPVSSYSHRVPIWPLAEKLVEEGHKVSIISPYPPKNPNPKITEITPPQLTEYVDKDSDLILELRLNDVVSEGWDYLFQFGLEACEILLKSKEMKEFLKKGEKFDLIFIDALCNECGFGLVHKHKAKHILLGTSTLFPWNTEVFGHPAETNWIPDIQYFYPQQMTFIQKVKTTLRVLSWHFERKWSYLPALEKLIKDGMNLPDLPSIEKMEKNVSVILQNTHYSIEYARSLPPLYVPIAGIHCKESNKPLPKEIGDLIDGAKDGFVFVSFGTHAQIWNVGKELQQVFFDSFAHFKNIKFIWKWGAERPKEMPENVLTVKWAPQQEILSHPKIKFFLSHGGLLSIQESVYNKVPLVVMPLFAEQDYNAEIVERNGYGTTIQLLGLTKEILINKMSSILNDQKYKNRIIEVSKSFREQPIHPLDSAIWWTKFALRNEDTANLKPLSMNQNFFQRRLLDVWLFVFSSLLAIIYLSYFILKFIFSFICGKKDLKKVKKH